MTTSIEMLLDQIEDGDWDEHLDQIGQAYIDRRNRRNRIKVDPTEEKHGLFRRDAPETSKKAALTIKTGDARYRVLELICEENNHDGVIREEIGLALGMNDNTVRPRVRELVQMGLVRVARTADGSNRTRKTSTGHQADVLCPTAEGQSRYLEVSRAVR